MLNRFIYQHYVFSGAFSDFIFYFLTDLKSMKATVVDGGKYPVSFICRSDVGFVLGKALADPSY
jgi:hypothetical protein